MTAMIQASTVDSSHVSFFFFSLFAVKEQHLPRFRFSQRQLAVSSVVVPRQLFLQIILRQTGHCCCEAEVMLC